MGGAAGAGMGVFRDEGGRRRVTGSDVAGHAEGPPGPAVKGAA